MQVIHTRIINNIIFFTRFKVRTTPSSSYRETSKGYIPDPDRLHSPQDVFTLFRADECLSTSTTVSIKPTTASRGEMLGTPRGMGRW